MPRDLVVSLPFSPRAHQRVAHERRERFSVLVWHRRSGKTVFSIVELILAALSCAKSMGRFGYVAPQLKQAKALAWDYLKHYTRVIPGCAYNEAELSVRLPGNGAVLRLFGADNPDALRGLYFDGVVLDEVAQMRPEVWGEIIRPELADRGGWALFIGTPKGVNLFAELFHRAQTEAGWYADVRRAEDTGAVPADELDRARREMSPAQYSQEFECDFTAAVENALVGLDLVTAAMARQPKDEEYFFAAKVLGVDLARTGGDEVVIFPRQGVKAGHPHGFRPAALVGDAVLMEVAGQVARFIDSYHPDATFLDRGGLGAGVVDRLRSLGYKVHGVDFGGTPARKGDEPDFANKRSEMWWRLAGWLRDGGALPSVQRLVVDLTAPTYSWANAKGKFDLESKDDLKARGFPSPDYGDALALTFASPVSPRSADEALAGRERLSARTNHDFDPFEVRHG